MRLSPLTTCCVVLAACTSAPGPTAPPPTTSYTRDVQPLVERSCATCHQEGGIAPFSLTSYDAVRANGARLVDAVDAGRMPPFFASADCAAYEGDERLTASELALLEKWVAEGAPPGTAEEARHAEVPPAPTIRRDLVLGFPGDFDVRLDGGVDNYRCFPLDPGNTSDLQVSGYELLPDNLPVLHHMLAYAIDPSDVPQLQALDDADPGPGYTCFGGVGVQKALLNQVAGWVPGAAATQLPANTGLTLKAGARIVMQIHYNTAALYRSSTPTVDHTHLALQVVDAGTLTTANVLPMLDHALNIKANDAASVQTAEVPIKLLAGDGGVIYAVTGHMHKLGTSVRTELVHADGTTSCLLHIPDWDFNWQRTYALKSPVQARAGDKLRITCIYDNSQANQPYLNGQQLTPRDVAWGESSYDEMCMTYMTFTK